MTRVPGAGPEPWMSRARIAKHMDVSERTIDRWVKEGMPGETWGLSRRVFQASAVERWARSRTAGARRGAGTR
jgi:phage terminase Nu1 subunit (DNA packaging protein)